MTGVEIVKSAGDNFVLRSNLGETFSTLSAMPGRKRWKERDLIFQPSGVNIAYLMEHYPEAQWEEGTAEARDNYITLKQQEENNRAIKESITELDSKRDGYRYATKPYDHQRRSFMLARDMESWGHFHEQGTGKTKIVIDTASYLYERGKINTMIVIAPNGVHIDWVLNAVPTHLPPRIPLWMDYYSSSLTQKQYQRLWDQAEQDGIDLRIITFNVEGFSSERAKSLLEHWLKSSEAMLVIDESSRIGDYHAMRTKYLIDIARTAKVRRIMSGTPVTRGIENLFSQFKFLDPLIIGHEAYTTFKNEYCIEGKFKNVVGYRNVEKITKIISGFSDRVLKSECLDLPEKVYRRMPFELSDKQRKLYDAYRKDSLKEVKSILGEDETTDRAAEIAIVKALRLHQIACGWSPNESPARIEGPQPRMQTLMEEIEEAEAAGKKYIVWARFVEDLKEIHSKIKGRAVLYIGDTDKNSRISAIERFQQDARISGFVGHTRAAGIGLTLTAATRVIYHSNLSDLELRLQSEDRAHRIGTTESVVYTDLEAVRTIDRRIINCLRDKKRLAEQILQDPTSIFMEEQ